MLVALCLPDPWRTIELRPLNRPRDRAPFRAVHTLVSRRLFDGILYMYIYYIYIYHPPWKFNILQEQIIWTVTPALYFLPLRECRLVLRVYHYPITMGYEDVWLYFPGWNWRYNLPCQRKLLYPRCRARCRFTIGGGGGGGGRHGLLEAACNDLPKLDQREEWVSRKSFGDDVEFEVCFWKRIPFLEKGIYFDEYDVICSSGKVIMN